MVLVVVVIVATVVYRQLSDPEDEIGGLPSYGAVETVHA